MVQWYNDKVVHRYSATVVHWYNCVYTGTVIQWYNGTVYTGTVQWYSTVVHWYSIVEHWHNGIVVQWCSGTV